MTYDVVIIGAGPAGIFTAFEIVRLRPRAKVALIEAGNDLYSRRCPISTAGITDCIGCNPCSIMRGFGGAGAFSDGKYNFTTRFGGWLSDYVPESEVLNLIEYVDSVNLEFGAPGKVYSSTNSPFATKALQYDLHLLEASVRHLGTENNLLILQRLYDCLKDKLVMEFNTAVDSIEIGDSDGEAGHLDNGKSDEGEVEGEVESEGEGENKGEVAGEGGFRLTLKRRSETSMFEITCRYLVASPGRAGAEWFAHQCRRLGLKLLNNQVDVGVRVELPAGVFKHITDEVYEAKLLYRTKQYGDLVRTFCMNPYGYVVSENTDGIVTVNGHSYADPGLASANTNFALLVSNRFTEPFNEPHQYGKRIASFSNMLGGGIIVQRFRDLMSGRRTNDHRLAKSFTKPTLKATPGDLSLVLPKRHLDNIIEMIIALDKLAPGTANDDTLLYGVEVKFYSSRIELTTELETQLPGMFAIGDGAGVTRGLSQASASGVLAGRSIARRL